MTFIFTCVLLSLCIMTAATENWINKNAVDTKFLPILNCIDDIIVDQYTASKSEIIGEGGFGIVIRGIRADRSQKYVAFKIELAKRSHIPHELEALHTLNAHIKDKKPVHVPRLYASKLNMVLLQHDAEPVTVNIMVMQWLGETLWSAVKRDEGLPLNIIFMNGAQLLRGLRSNHQHGILHNDLKLANLLFGRDKYQHTLYICDYSFTTKPGETWRGGSLHYQSNKILKMIASGHGSKAITTTHDELESLFFVLQCMVMRTLPSLYAKDKLKKSETSGIIPENPAAQLITDAKNTIKLRKQFETPESLQEILSEDKTDTILKYHAIISSMVEKTPDEVDPHLYQSLLTIIESSLTPEEVANMGAIYDSNGILSNLKSLVSKSLKSLTFHSTKEKNPLTQD